MHHQIPLFWNNAQSLVGHILGTNLWHSCLRFLGLLSPRCQRNKTNHCYIFGAKFSKYNLQNLFTWSWLQMARMVMLNCMFVFHDVSRGVQVKVKISNFLEYTSFATFYASHKLWRASF